MTNTCAGRSHIRVHLWWDRLDRFHERFPQYGYACRVGETSQARKVRSFSIYRSTRAARTRTRRTSPRVKRLLRLSRCDLRHSFKTYDERDVVGLGAREGGRLSPACLFRALAREKLNVSEGAKPDVSLDQALPGGLPTGAKTFN